MMQRKNLGLLFLGIVFIVSMLMMNLSKDIQAKTIVPYIVLANILLIAAIYLLYGKRGKS